MLLHHREYVPISTIFHSGDMQTGHLQAAVLTEFGWYTTDDGRVALEDPEQLSGVLDKLTFVWLLREDVILIATFSHSRIQKAAWYIHHGHLQDLKKDEALLDVLAHNCADCGIQFFGAPELYEHIQSRHPGLHTALRSEYLKLVTSLDAAKIPCRLCKATWHPRRDTGFELHRQHVCPTVMNLALAHMYYWASLCPLGSRYELPPANPTVDEGPMLPEYPLPAADPIGAFLDALLH